MARVLVLGREDLEKVVDPCELVDVVAKAYASLSEGSAVAPQRTVMTVKGCWWGVMAAQLPWTGVAVKVVNIIEQNRERGLPVINALVTYYDADTGQPLAVIDGAALTGLRTGAGGAVSVKYMAPKPARKAAFIGTGVQARYMLRMIKAVAPELEECSAYDVRKEAAEKFCEYSESLGVKCTVAATAREAVKDARIVVLATTSPKPVISASWLTPPVHVISIGVTGPEGREVGSDVVAAAEVVAVDSIEACLSEVADIRAPLMEGAITRNKIVEIGEIVAGKKKGRIGDGITLFKSVGVAVQDAVAADLAYRKAVEKGVGRYVEL